MSFLPIISKKSKHNQGIAQIPIILGLLLMAIAIPVVTKLTQQEQDIRDLAVGGCKYCDNGICRTRTTSCIPDKNGCVSNSDCPAPGSGVCTPNCGCASSTPKGETCPNGCGGFCDGQINPAQPTSPPKQCNYKRCLNGECRSNSATIPGNDSCFEYGYTSSCSDNSQCSTATNTPIPPKEDCYYNVCDFTAKTCKTGNNGIHYQVSQGSSCGHANLCETDYNCGKSYPTISPTPTPTVPASNCASGGVCKSVPYLPALGCTYYGMNSTGGSCNGICCKTAPSPTNIPSSPTPTKTPTPTTIPQICRPGLDIRCRGSAIEQCDSTGYQWEILTTCPGGCGPDNACAPTAVPPTPILTCKSPNSCKVSGGGRANCASYGMTSVSGKTCPPDQVCCAPKPANTSTPIPTPTPTPSSLWCSFDSHSYKPGTVICGQGGFFSRCKDGQKCTCGQDGKWQTETCPSGQCQNNSCTQACLYQSQSYGQDDTVCDTNQNKAGTCASNGQWIWVTCDQDEYCSQGLCLPQKCCCSRDYAQRFINCSFQSIDSCSQLSSSPWQAPTSQCLPNQPTSPQPLPTSTPQNTPIPTPTLKPILVNPGSQCSPDNSTYCGGSPAKQFLCISGLWTQVATCDGSCQGNNCAKVQNNCDYIILRKIGQCGQFCSGLNEIQYEVQTGVRNSDGTCQILNKCYPRGECTVRTGCTNGQLNGSSWCSASRACTCQKNQIECSDPCTYGCQDGLCGKPDNVDQLKFVGNLSPEDFFTLDDTSLIAKRCNSLIGSQQQKDDCLANTRIEDLIKGLDADTEAIVTSLRQLNLRKLDYLNMDSQSLAQKYCNGISTCIDSFNPDNLLSGLSSQELQAIKQQKADFALQSKLQDYLTLSKQSLAEKYCQSSDPSQDIICITNFNPDTLLEDLDQTQRDQITKQKQASQILSAYQTYSLVSADVDHIDAEEERVLVGQCLNLGGNCQNKEEAIQYFLKLSAPQQSDSSYDLILANIESQKVLEKKDLDAYNRISKTLTLLNIIDPQTGQLDPKYAGQTFQELEQKLNDMKQDPTVRAVLLYNNMTGGAAKRGLDIAYADDATAWDFVRGNFTYAAPGAGMAVTVATLPLAPLMGGPAALAYLGTGMGISGTVNSLSYTAETCGGPNFSLGQCGLAAARTGFMAVSTGVGIASQSVSLASQTAGKSGLFFNTTNALAKSKFATGIGLKLANTATSAFGTALFGTQTVQSFQQEGLTFNTLINASITVTSGARFISSITRNGTISTLANTTRTVVDNTSDTIQVFTSCSQSFSDPSQIANCIADATAIVNDVSEISNTKVAKSQSLISQEVDDIFQRGLIADSDIVQRYIANMASDSLNTKLADIETQRLATIKSLGDNPDVDAIKAINQSFADQTKITNQNARNNFAVDTYEATRLLSRIQSDNLKINITDDQGNPRPIADIQSEVEATLKARNPIISDYVSTKMGQAGIDSLDADGLTRLIAATGLPVKINQDDGTPRPVDQLRVDVQDALSRQVNQEAQLVADTVIAAKSIGQDLAYKNPDGSLIDFTKITDQEPIKSADPVSQAVPKTPDQPNIIQKTAKSVADAVTKLASSIIPARSPSSSSSVTASTDDLLLITDQIKQNQLSIKPTTDDQGQQVYRLQVPDDAADNIKIATDKVNQVISEFESDFTHPIRQDQLDLFLKPESIKQLQAGGGKTSVMAHLEASVKRNLVFVMPNQTDAESFVREVNLRQQFYKDKGLDVVYYDSQRGFLSLNDNFNITKAKQISYGDVLKLADIAGADPTKHGLVIVTTSSDNGWGLIRGKQNLASADGLMYDAVLGQRNFHLVVDEIGAQVDGEFSVSSGRPQKLSQLTNPTHMYGYLDPSDMVSASHLVDQIPEIDQFVQAVNQKLASGQSNQDLFFKYDGQIRPQPADPTIVNRSYSSLIDSALTRSGPDISDDLKTKLQDLSAQLKQSGDESLRREFTSVLETISTDLDRALITDLSYMTSYLQSKWKVLSMVPGNNFALEADGLVLRKLGGTSGEKFSQLTDMIALQANGVDMLRSAGIDVSSGKIIPIEDLTYTPDSAKISNLEIFKAKATLGRLSGYDATPDTAASAIGTKATATSEKPRQPSFFTKAEDMNTLVRNGISQDYLDANSGKALAVVIADEGVSYKTTTDAYLARQMELRGQTEITMARTKYKTELGGNQLTEYYLETVTRNPDGSVNRKITSSYSNQDAWSQKIHQLLGQDPQKVTIVFEGRTRAVDLKVEDTSKNVAWQVIASDANTMEDITQAWKRNRVAAGTGAAASWSQDDIDQFSQFSLLVRSTDDNLTADNVIDTYQQRLAQKLARDNFDTTIRQIAEAPKRYVDDIKNTLKARSDYDQISASLDLLSADVDRVARANIMDITYKPLDSDQIPELVYTRGRLVYEQLKSGIDTIVNQYKLTDTQAQNIRQTAGLDQPFITRAQFDSLLDQPARSQDLSLTGPNGLVKNWAMANAKDQLPQYAWSQPADPQTVAQLNALDTPVTTTQSKITNIASDLAQLNIPRGYNVNTGQDANWFQLTFNNWPGKAVSTAFDQLKDQINSGQISTQEQLKQSLDQSLIPGLIPDSDLRQAIIDQVLAGPIAQSLKSDVADRAQIIRTTPKGSQESQQDYQQRIDDKWNQRQALIDQAQTLGLDLDASIGSQPWSTFEPRAQTYINKAKELNQQAQDIGLNLSDGGPKTITQLSDLVTQKQAEIATQTQQQLKQAITKAQDDYGVILKGDTADEIRSQVDDVKNQITDLESQSGLAFRSDDSSESLAQFKSRSQTHISNQEEQKVTQTLANDLNTRLQNLNLASDNSDTLKQSLDSLAQIQLDLQNNPLYQDNRQLQQLNTDIQTKIDQVAIKINDNLNQVSQTLDQVLDQSPKLALPYNPNDDLNTSNQQGKTSLQNIISGLSQTTDTISMTVKANITSWQLVMEMVRQLDNQVSQMTVEDLSSYSYHPDMTQEDFISQNKQILINLFEAKGLDSTLRQQVGISEEEWQVYINNLGKWVYQKINYIGQEQISQTITDQLPINQNNLSMYEIPGQDSITQRTLDRYGRDKAKYDESIAKLANSTLTIEKIKSVPETDRTSLIRQGLSSSDPQVQLASAEMIQYAPITDRASLIRQGLSSSDPQVQLALAKEIIYYAPTKDITPLRDLVATIVKKGLSSSDPQVRIISAEMILYAPSNNRASLVKKGLSSSDPQVRIISAEMIRYSHLKNDKERNSFLSLVTQKVKKGLSSSDPQVQLASAEMIQYALSEDKAYLENLVTKKVKQGLSSSDPQVQLASAEMIQYAPITDRDSLENLVTQKVKQGLSSSDPQVQISVIPMVKYSEYAERQKLIDLIIEKSLSQYLIAPPLYAKGGITKENFSRSSFEKTGSETVLIGGDLKDKAIIRVISPVSFIAWQKLYENSQLWQEAGFDYVPIEPILSYSPGDDGLVRVFSGVLDLSLASWLSQNSSFKDGLISQRDNILQVLEDLGFQHGHTHNGNFCLRFFRDENGQPDLNRVPRLYLIDFDRSQSPQTRSLFDQDIIQSESQAKSYGVDLSTITSTGIQRIADIQTQIDIIIGQFNTSFTQIKSVSDAIDMSTDKTDIQTSNLKTLIDQLQSLQDLISQNSWLSNDADQNQQSSDLVAQIQDKIKQTQDKISQIDQQVAQTLEEDINQPQQLALPPPQSDQPLETIEQPLDRVSQFYKNIVDGLTRTVQDTQQNLMIAFSATQATWSQISSILNQLEQSINNYTQPDLSSFQWNPDISFDDFVSQNTSTIASLLETNGLNSDFRSKAGINDNEWQKYINTVAYWLNQRLGQVGNTSAYQFQPTWYQGQPRMDVVDQTVAKITDQLPKIGKDAPPSLPLFPVSNSTDTIRLYRGVFSFDPRQLQLPQGLRRTDISVEEAKLIGEKIRKNTQIDLYKSLITHKNSPPSYDPFMGFSSNIDIAKEFGSIDGYVITVDIPQNRLYTIDQDRKKVGGSYSTEDEYVLMEALDPSWVADIQYYSDLVDEPQYVMSYPQAESWKDLISLATNSQDKKYIDIIQAHSQADGNLPDLDKFNTVDQAILRVIAIEGPSQHPLLNGIKPLIQATTIDDVFTVIDFLQSNGDNKYDLSDIRNQISSYIQNSNADIKNIKTPIFRRIVEQITFNQFGYHLPVKPITISTTPPPRQIDTPVAPTTSFDKTLDSIVSSYNLNQTLLNQRTDIHSIDNYFLDITDLINQAQFDDAKNSINRLKIVDIGSEINHVRSYIDGYDIGEMRSQLEYSLREKLESQLLDTELVYDLIKNRFGLSKSVPGALLAGDRSGTVDTRLGEELTYEVASYLTSLCNTQNKLVDALLRALDTFQQSTINQNADIKRKSEEITDTLQQINFLISITNIDTNDISQLETEIKTLTNLLQSLQDLLSQNPWLSDQDDLRNQINSLKSQLEDKISQARQKFNQLQQLSGDIATLENRLNIPPNALFDPIIDLPLSREPAQRILDLQSISNYRQAFKQVSLDIQNHLLKDLDNNLNIYLKDKTFSSTDQLRQAVYQFARQRFDVYYQIGYFKNPVDNTKTWMWNQIARALLASTQGSLTNENLVLMTESINKSMELSPTSRYLDIIYKELSYQQQSGSRVVAVGDIHGDWNQFVNLASQPRPNTPAIVDKSGKKWITPKDTKVVILGDMLDRAPNGQKSYQVVTNLMNLQQQAGKDDQGNNNLTILMGNHELIMLTVLEKCYARVQGGQSLEQAAEILAISTFNSYLNIDKDDIIYLYTHPKAVNWLRNLPFIYRYGDTIYQHSNSIDYREFGGSVQEINNNLKKVVAEGSAVFNNFLYGQSQNIDLKTLTELITQGHKRIRDISVLNTQTVNDLLTTFKINPSTGKVVHGHDPYEASLGGTQDTRVTNVDTGMSLHYGARLYPNNPGSRGTVATVDQPSLIVNVKVNPVKPIQTYLPDSCSSCSLIRQKVQDLIEKAKQKGEDAIEWSQAFKLANDHRFGNVPEQFELNFLIWLNSFFVKQDAASRSRALIWAKKTTTVIEEVLMQPGLSGGDIIDLNLRLARIKSLEEEVRNTPPTSSSIIDQIKAQLQDIYNSITRLGNGGSDITPPPQDEANLPVSQNDLDKLISDIGKDLGIKDLNNLSAQDWWKLFDYLPDDINFYRVGTLGSSNQIWSLDLQTQLDKYQDSDNFVLEAFRLGDLKQFINQLELADFVKPIDSNWQQLELLRRYSLPPELIKTYIMLDDGAWLQLTFDQLSDTITNTFIPLPGQAYYFPLTLDERTQYIYIVFDHLANQILLNNYGPPINNLYQGITILTDGDSFNLGNQSLNFKKLDNGQIEISFDTSDLSFYLDPTLHLYQSYQYPSQIHPVAPCSTPPYLS